MQKIFIKNIPKILSAALLVGLVLSYFFIPEVEQFFNKSWEVLSSGEEKRIKEWVSSFGWLGPAVLIFAMIAQMFLIVIPSIVLMVVCILAYGPIWGSLLVFIAVGSASTVGFYLGKGLGSGLVSNLIGDKTESKLEDFLENYGFWAIAITRLNPFLSNDAISFVAGSLKMNFLKFIFATLTGIAPLTAYIAFIGKDTDNLKSGLLWGSLIILLLFAGYIYWDKKVR
ncbi:MAG: TVP38/TMEM64 family protein [Leeuwenhoekiella sp.]